METVVILKNNAWNRMFHHKKLELQEDKYLEYQKLIGLGPETLQFVKISKTLEELLDAHKIAWFRGYRNDNLGPCEYGMFRTKDISTMVPNEVYLGNIWGLWTFNIPSWNKYSEETMVGNGYGINPETKVYDLIMSQYKTLLTRNIESIIYEAKEYCRTFDNEI